MLGRGKYFRKKLFSTRRILNKNFPAKGDFCFLQVGANDGVSFDFLYDFVIKREASGIVIEPIKEYYEELCENYKIQPKILKINKAVHKNEKSVTLYKIEKSKINLYPDWVKGIASFDLNHLTKFDIITREHIVKEHVKADHLMKMVAESNLNSFDYFQIDTEGYDFQIVDMFDFSKYKPKVVKAEFVNLPALEKEGMKRKLMKLGYYVFYEGLDIVGINLKVIKL